MNPPLPALDYEVRVYCPHECLVFCKTREEGGWCSNMAGGYLIGVNDKRVLTSEALYQTFRFPHRPDIQQEIIACRSPMAAKMVAKKYRDHTRSDWDNVRVGAMWWSLLAKLACNPDRFGNRLNGSTGKLLVEKSHKDDFWGTKLQPDGTLKGRNVLGILLMGLREVTDTWIDTLLPPGDLVPTAMFLGNPIT